MAQYRAEILTIFGLYFGRNDGFMNSFCNFLLTFRRQKYLLIFGENLVIPVIVHGLEMAVYHGTSALQSYTSGVDMHWGTSINDV